MSIIKNEIKLVIGDTLDITFLLKSDIDIKEAYFICRDLNISQKLTQSTDKNTWRLLVDENQTKFLASGNFDYDIKVVFFDNTFYTACYRASLMVLPNVNYLERRL